MIGTIINTAAILLGSLVGCLVRRGVPERLRDTITQAMALCVLLIGAQGALGTQAVMCVLLSLVAGSALGALINIEKRLDRFGERLQRRFHAGGDFGKGFVTASLLFCVGAMAIVGAMDSGLRGDHATLLAKSVLDGITSIFFAAAMGPGVALSAAAVFVYQGAIALLAQVVAPLLTAAVVTEMSAVGGLLVLGIGLNMLREKRIPVGNMLPAIFLPVLLARFFT